MELPAGLARPDSSSMSDHVRRFGAT